MATLGALCGLVASSVWVAPIDIRWLLLFFILISGLVATARYSLGAHSIFQLYLGYVYGFFVMFVFLYRLSNPNFI
jgi:membrane-associated phospholipid phosphatase